MQGKAPLAPNAPIDIHVGIDVCKAWLDVYFHPAGETFRFANDADGLKRLKREFARFRVVRVVMEATAKFHRLAHRNLHDSGFAVAVINPARGRCFADALGTIAKTDRIDARVLALFSEAIDPRASAPCSLVLEQAQELVGARQNAVADRTAFVNQRGAATTSFLRAELKRRIDAAGTFIKRLEAEIARLIETDPAMARRVEILESIPGIGTITAVALAVGLAELGSVTNKKIALLVGLAPVARDSGDTSGKRHIEGGREHVRTAVYMAAVTAARCNEDLKAFYDRLVANGKLAKVALAAVMRKLVVLGNTLITENRLWTPIRPVNNLHKCPV